MARMSFNDFQKSVNEPKGSTTSTRIKFFSLKDDKEEALVRIMHDNLESFDMGYTHTIDTANGKRKVSCLRENLNSPVDACPLCKEGSKLFQKIFIHMVRYDKAEDGSIVATPCVWERDARTYGNKLATLLNEYGPLSDCIFKIRRNGKAGSKDTTYEILFGNPNLYNPEIYKKDTEAFDHYSAFGTIVMEKSFEELSNVVNTNNNEIPNNYTEPQVNTPRVEPTQTYTQTSPDVPFTMEEPTPRPTYNTPTNQGMNRPTRYY